MSNDFSYVISSNLILMKRVQLSTHTIQYTVKRVFYIPKIGIYFKELCGRIEISGRGDCKSQPLAHVDFMMNKWQQRGSS